LLPLLFSSRKVGGEYANNLSRQFKGNRNRGPSFAGSEMR
jgi:hypothetical protein